MRRLMIYLKFGSLLLSSFLITSRVEAQCGAATPGDAGQCVNEITTYTAYQTSPPGASCPISRITGGSLGIDYNWPVSGDNSKIKWLTGGNYTVIYDCSCGEVSQVITVFPSSVSGGTISDKTTCYGSTTTLTASGATEGSILGWESKLPSQSWSQASWHYETSNTLTIAGTFETREYRLKAGNECVSSQFSNVATLTVVAAPPIINNTTGTCGSQTLTVSGTPPSGYSLFWQGPSPTGSTATPASSSQPYIVAGTGTYYLGVTNGSCWTYSSIVVTYNPLPNPPTASFSVDQSENYCGTRYITSTGVVPSGDTWWFQGTNQFGTSLSHQAPNNSYPASQEGNNAYYLRAKGSNGCWSSTSASVMVRVNLYPADPPTPVDITPGDCGAQQISVSGTAPAGALWYWQSTLNGTSTATPTTGGNYTAVLSGSVYVGAYSGSCWSYSTPLSVTAVPLPDPPDAGDLSASGSSSSCGSRQIFAAKTTGNDGAQWMWQGTNANGTVISSPTPTYTASVTGTTSYYLRAFKNSCWSASSAGISLTVNAFPAVPDIPVVSPNECGPKILSKANPAWYWLGTDANGTDYTSETATAATFTAPFAGTRTYYLGARSQEGCWSRSSLSVTYKLLPDQPSMSVVNQSCGFATVGKTHDRPNWYWLPDEHTRTFSNGAIEYQVNSDQTVYLGSYHENGCWLVASLNVDVVNDNPSFSVPANIVLCKEDNTTITAIGQSLSYLWYDASGNLMSSESVFQTPKISGTTEFNVFAFDQNGCYDVKTTTISVIQPPQKPAKPFLSRTDQSLYVNPSNTNTSSVAYYWQSQPDATSTTETGPTIKAGGSYYLRGMNAEGCWGPAAYIEVPDLSPSDYDQTINPNNVNYVRTYQYQKKNITGDPALATKENVMTSTVYFDGLGRPLQKTSHQGSAAGFDIIQPLDYDAYGREVLNLLPWVASTTSGIFQSAPFSAQRQFYQTAPNVAHDLFPVSYSTLENAVTGRVLSQGSPGMTWQPGQDHVITNNYSSNSSQEVIKFNFADGALSVMQGAQMYYAEKTLARKMTANEQQQVVFEFTDGEGRVICKKVEASTGVYASTYYIYDDFGNLVVVVPPEGVKSIVDSLPTQP